MGSPHRTVGGGSALSKRHLVTASEQLLAHAHRPTESHRHPASGDLQQRGRVSHRSRGGPARDLSDGQEGLTVANERLATARANLRINDLLLGHAEKVGDTAWEQGLLEARESIESAERVAKQSRDAAARELADSRSGQLGLPLSSIAPFGGVWLFLGLWLSSTILWGASPILGRWMAGGGRPTLDSPGSFLNSDPDNRKRR